MASTSHSLERPTVARLDRQLWAGFATYAVKELDALKSSDAGPEERAAAAWVLARWFASIGDYASALDELSRAKRLAAEEDWGVDQRLLEIFTLVKLGRASEAETALQDALNRLGELPEICLVAANVVGLEGRGNEDQSGIDRRRLSWINKPFIAARLAPIELADPQRPLTFDNLATAPVVKHAKAGTAKLSVIMPAYNAAKTLSTALGSVLAQSWDNLEVLVVDDASTDDTWTVIQTFAAADARVRPLRHDQNRGTYVARNTGLRHASGELVTVHDADDWSHAEKFAVQAADLLMTGKPFNTTMSVRILFDMAVRLKVVNSAVLHHNIGSLMARRCELIAIGGWDEPRIGADDELYYRVLKINHLDQNSICAGVALTFTLIREDSLSASSATGVATIKYGAHRQYKEAYSYWHGVEGAKAKPNLVMSEGARPFPIPAICKTQRADQLHYDILHVSDFSQSGVNAVLNAYMLEAGHRIGLKQAWFQWPSIKSVSRYVDPRVRRRAHAGMADCIVAGENVDCDVAIVSHPAILCHVPDPLPTMRAKTCILVADQPPFEESKDYDFDQAVRTAREIFHAEPIVAPMLPNVRHNIRERAKGIRLAKDNWLPTLDTASWKRDASQWDGNRSPIIGGYTLHYLERALKRRRSLRYAYCADQPYEVRILDRENKHNAEEGEVLSANWRFVSAGDAWIRDLLANLDFCICYPHERSSGTFDPAPIEAMAVGVPVILPSRFRHVYGSAAIYAEPDSVLDAIKAIWRSKSRYTAQVERGFRFVEANCSDASFAQRLEPFLTGHCARTGAWSELLGWLTRRRYPSRSL